MSVGAHTARIAGTAVVLMGMSLVLLVGRAPAGERPPVPPVQPAPPAAPEPSHDTPPQPIACHCEDLQVRLVQNSHVWNNDGRHAWGFGLSWTLDCRGKGTNGCLEYITFGNPSRGTLTGSFGSKLTTKCTGPCDGKTDGHRELTLRFTRTGAPLTITFTITFTCDDKTTTRTITLKFNARGWFLRGASDLDGDGRPDGR